MKILKIEYILFSFLILFAIFDFYYIKNSQYNINKNEIHAQDIKKGIKMGRNITLKYLHIDGYLPDTIYIDTELYNDLENFYIKNSK